MITNIYRVSVDIPEDVWQMFGHTSTYARMSIAATKGSLSAGRNACSDVEEWAECATPKEALACENRLKEMVQFFKEHLS